MDKRKKHDLIGLEAARGFVQAVQEAVEDRGGWKGSWAVRNGLKRAMVSNWATRGRVPGYWALALKTSLKGIK